MGPAPSVHNLILFIEIILHVLCPIITEFLGHFDITGNQTPNLKLEV